MDYNNSHSLLCVVFDVNLYIRPYLERPYVESLPSFRNSYRNQKLRFAPSTTRLFSSRFFLLISIRLFKQIFLSDIQIFLFFNFCCLLFNLQIIYYIVQGFYLMVRQKLLIPHLFLYYFILCYCQYCMIIYLSGLFSYANHHRVRIFLHTHINIQIQIQL